MLGEDNNEFDLVATVRKDVSHTRNSGASSGAWLCSLMGKINAPCPRYLVC